MTGGMDRSVARVCAMKLLYEWEMGGDGGEDTRFGMLELKPNENEMEYMNRMVEGVTSNAETIDAQIAKYAIGWPLERITRVDLSILRLGVYELMLKQVPFGVVINEAVAMADQYSGDKAGAFINGVLGNIHRNEYQ